MAEADTPISSELKKKQSVQKILKWYRKKIEICPSADESVERDPSYNSILVEELLNEPASEMSKKEKFEEILFDLYSSKCGVTEPRPSEPMGFAKDFRLLNRRRKSKVPEYFRRNRLSSFFGKFLVHPKEYLKLQKSKSVAVEKEVSESDELESFVCERIFDDGRDVSLQPSYSKFAVPYNIICLDRVREMKRKFEQQFQYEIRQLLHYTQKAHEVAMLQSHVACTTLWPPLHNRKEIERTSCMFKLSNKERKRLEYIMCNEIT
ncbi:uncharacterized protein LOC119670112 [Teleopsis dalmanni]|uniref:uncharacterized protein LOC119670112 n=1 Tax=Teleopsis dalmanni TaxID=139649 RepID=UPI0018CF82F9|nr:uncharacterized protein LOC119670112 [Teleopsis dalmanni]